jgi:hypothetical protein
MREYAKVAPQFWIGRTGQELRHFGPKVQLVALYLLTGPQATMLGLYYLPLPLIAHETALSTQEVMKVLERLAEVGFAYYDRRTEFIWVPEMARYQIGERLDPADNRVKAVHKGFADLPDNPYLSAFYDKYQRAYHLPLRRASEAPSQLLQSLSGAPSKPLPSQEHEQEHEQAHEQEQEGEQEQDARLASPLEAVDCSLIPPPAAPDDTPWGTPEALIALYNRSIPRGHPRVIKRSPARLAKARKYLALFPDQAFWAQVFHAIGESAFLRGEKPTPQHKGFRADFDWLLSQREDDTENCVKVAEGRYRDHGRESLHGPALSATARHNLAVLEDYKRKKGLE